jgi:hypothetical protein
MSSKVCQESQDGTIVYAMNTAFRPKIPPPNLAACVTLFFLSSCAFIKPHAATDPNYIASHQKERQYWQKGAAQVYMGMTRREVEQLLPPDNSLSGIRGVGTFVSAGKTRPQAHLEQWYYLSPHFICSIEYDFTGLNYEPPQLALLTDDDPYPEFPEYSRFGSDPQENRELGTPTITLVEPSRVKKRHP